MLIQFNFKNFKSFRDDTTLDLSATRISEFSNHVISIGHEKVLPIAAIFGANASGKSNVLEAFRYMSTYVLSSLNYGGDDIKKKNKSEFLPPTPFLLDPDREKAESSFEVFFIMDEISCAKTYNYGFSVTSSGIIEEWLNFKVKTSKDKYKRIFYRNGDNIDLSGLPVKSQQNLMIALEKETLIVSLGAKLKIAKLKFIRDWFLNNELADFGHPVEIFFLSEQLPDDFIENKNVQNKVIKYFSSFDPSIVGFDVEPVEMAEDKKITKIRINALHRIINSDKTVAIPLKLESAGTLKMFALYTLMQVGLETGSVLWGDELNARLHPLLVRTFLITFLNHETNPKNAQLVFILNDKVLRNLLLCISNL